MFIKGFLLLIFCNSFLIYGLLKTTTLYSSSDEIFNLPGLERKLNFRQFSGFLNIPNGKFFHYWLVESQNSPADDPLILWLNGGPGCSSMLGILTENGPHRLDSNGINITENIWSWNKVANVIYLESPEGVGFSYADKDGNLNFHSGDEQVAKDNRAAIHVFLERFPFFKKNDFYISGESYAGVYIPMLANLILADKDINFKGVAIGNGAVDEKLLGTSLVQFLYNHGAIGSNHYEDTIASCCGSVSLRNCNISLKYDTPKCKSMMKFIITRFHDDNLDPYNILDVCAYHSSSDPGGLPCFDHRAVRKYFANKDVKKALNIPFNFNWDGPCSTHLNYNRTVFTVAPYIKRLVENKMKILIYAGDTDMMCNFLGNQWFVEDLGYKKISESIPWQYEHPIFGKQVAGFTTTYSGITFATVKGSGHFVPMDKPQQAFTMLVNFLHS